MTEPTEMDVSAAPSAVQSPPQTPGPTSAPSAGGRPTWLAVVLVFSVATLLYLGSLWNGFAWDDAFIIESNGPVLAGDPVGRKRKRRMALTTVRTATTMTSKVIGHTMGPAEKKKLSMIAS